ncbi:MAG: DDE-type integrase/transposase/recombinase, partial [Candidatus Thiodiazotropha taylori]|nr:DDE-type integrase/transposase/recombinase [Candidatus Thiodiazotropha taylori]MCW4308799.1 RNase H-like domain-containing protein [Candidatus Thiodiazotropha endolucinida]
FKDELNRMEKDSIISRVTQPTDWVNSVVLVEKPATNKLRVCLDPKALNESIRRPHYQMPTLDDVVSQLSGAKTFSKLDITHAFWSIKLDDESSYLTTFSTPFGRYRYLRLPFGISASSDLFQQKMDEICEGLTGVKAIVDDILCYGRSTQEHDENLRKLLERAGEKGVRFNPEKCTIGVHEVPFFGHVISDQGLKADPSKIEAIVNLEPPDSKEKLETLLGMANYMSKFAPRLADITAPLRVLLQDKVAFCWDAPQQRAFEEVKSVITNSPALGFYDPSEPLTLESDASKNGLGSCLMQNDQLIAYASKSLTKTEQGYAQIEKELLAILFGCKRFHQYTYGRPIRVHTDHKPIESIMKKPLSAASPRLQRMLLQLQNYDLDVHYVRGTDIPVSDFLSRHSLTDTHPKLIEGLDLHVHAIKQQLFVTDSRLDSIRTAIKNDNKMQKLKQTIACGWPDLRAECDPEIQDFWNHRDELSFEDDLIFRGQKLLIPPALRQEMISKVHTGHLGVSKTLERAKDNLFWPGMSKDITKHVLQCATCLKHRDSNAKEPLIPHEFPDRPYQKIGVDLFHYDGKEHLLTVDYYSRFFEIDCLPDTRAATVIQKLKVHLSRNGLVDICVTDNGPQFSSELFRDFANEWGFEHKTSSPLHPMCNGLAEKSVGIAKKLLAKAKDSNQDPYIALLEYRNTPLLDCNMSPAQLLYSRRTKSIVPITNKLLQHQPINQSTVQKNMQKAKAKQKAKFDKSAKPLPPLSINESVRIQAGKFWRPAKVIKKHDARSYTLHRRNRNH